MSDGPASRCPAHRSTAAGPATTVQFVADQTSDAVFRFKFKGKCVFQAQMTSQPEVYQLTQVGPSAMFLD